MVGARFTNPFIFCILSAIELMLGCDFQSLLYRITARRTMEIAAMMDTAIRVMPLVWCMHTQYIAMKNVTSLDCGGLVEVGQRGISVTAYPQRKNAAGMLKMTARFSMPRLDSARSHKYAICRVGGGDG